MGRRRRRDVVIRTFAAPERVPVESRELIGLAYTRPLLSRGRGELKCGASGCSCPPAELTFFHRKTVAVEDERKHNERWG